jgi:hypothetical protein
MTSRSTSLTALSLFASLVLMSCGANTTPSPVQVPGREVTTKSAVLEAGAAALQAMPPIQQLNLYLDGFHFAADDMGHQMEAHHYCAQLNEEVHQCALYDGNGADAKLIGVEYIISERLFSQLPSQEKPFWHSHRYEVKSGQLIMPGIPTRVEREAMEKLVSTYGKTWQANPTLIQACNQRFGVSTDAKAQDRQGIPAPPVQPGADAWQGGTTVQLGTREVPVRNVRQGRQTR